MKIAGIILAAGRASRFGRPKQLLEIHGETLVARACKLAIAAELSPVFVVLGAHAEKIVAAGLPDGVEILRNGSWEDGMGSSLAAGAKEAMNRDVDGMMVLLADQPGISVDTLVALKSGLEDESTSIVLCDHGDSKGPPTLFDRRYLAELALLAGDDGGKEIVRSNFATVKIVSAPSAKWDIDDESVWDAFNRRPEI